MILVFVMYSSNATDAEATRANIAHISPNWKVECLSANGAARMNALLAAYEEPYFLTLQAGDLLHSQFLIELQERLLDVSDNWAGFVYTRHAETKDSTLPEYPLVWNTTAVKADRAPFFPEKDQLPFETYVCIDKMIQLSRSWQWSCFHSTWWRPRQSQNLAWQRKEEEWPLVRPILEAAPSSASGNVVPLMCIVICTYNNAEYVRWSIRSVLVQSNPQWELIIIDDASTDDTQLKLRSLPKDPRIRVHTNSLNLGKSQCLNIALSLCSAPLLLELDADDWLPPDCISALLHEIKSAQDETSVWYGDHHEWIERARKQLIYGGHRKAPASFRIEALLSDAMPIAPRCYRVIALQKLNGWLVDGPYEGRLYEDFEILIRLSRSYGLSYIPKILYHRRIRSSSITHLNSDKYASWKQWVLEQ
jgi:hypothetical protein